MSAGEMSCCSSPSTTPKPALENRDHRMRGAAHVLGDRAELRPHPHVNRAHRLAHTNERAQQVEAQPCLAGAAAEQRGELGVGRERGLAHELQPRALGELQQLGHRVHRQHCLLRDGVRAP